MPSSSASDREQQIGQDATENERQSKQEFQNRIHHGLLQGDQLDAKPQTSEWPYTGYLTSASILGVLVTAPET